MAHTGARAMEFLEDLKGKTEARFRQENEELREFRRSLEGAAARPVEPWDVAYYAEKQRAALYDFDEEALRPYFPLESVVAGLFEMVRRLYGIRVTEEAGRSRLGSGRCATTTCTMRPERSWAPFTPTGIRAKTNAAARGWRR